MSFISMTNQINVLIMTLALWTTLAACSEEGGEEPPTDQESLPEILSKGGPAGSDPNKTEKKPAPSQDTEEPTPNTADVSDAEETNSTPQVPAPPPLPTPSVAVVGPPAINSTNTNQFSLQGTCSEEGAPVTISFENQIQDVVCIEGAWTSNPTDFTSLGEGETIVFTIIHYHSSGTTTQLQHQLIKDTLAPTVSLMAPADVNLNNRTSYSLSGHCSENGSSVSIAIGNMTHFTQCESGSYSLHDIDASLLTETLSLAVSAEITDLAGNHGTPSTTNIAVDLTAPEISMTSAPGITAANILTYSVIGTCSEHDQQVTVSIGSVQTNCLCENGTWTTGNLDVSPVADGNVTITANHTDSAGNQAVPSQAFVEKQTTIPTVSITSVTNINGANETSYSLSGDCSENGAIVAISIGAGTLEYAPYCSSGRWYLNNIDVSNLNDAPAITITADHQNAGGIKATQANATVSKDSASPTVTITSAPNIHTGNAETYQISGTCSENGEAVSLQIDTLSFTPICNSGTWISGYQNVSTLSEGIVNITADHSSTGGETAEQAIASVIKATATPAVSDLSVAVLLKSTAELAWTLNDPDGFSIESFVIQFRVKGTTTWLNFAESTSTSNSAQVTGLNPSTYYQFRVAVKYDNDRLSEWSNLAEGETKPDTPLFDSPYKAMNVGGATDAKVVAFFDNTNITLNGEPLTTLNKGDVFNFPTSQFDVIDADRAIYTAGRRGTGAANRKANITFNPVAWAGKSFSFNAIRDNAQLLSVYAIEDTTVEVYQGPTLLASQSLEKNSGGTLSWSVYGSYQVVSSGTILAFHFSNSGGVNYVDPKPLLPSSNEILGIPSSSMRLTADLDGTNFTYWHSNSETGSSSLDRLAVVNLSPTGTSSLYRSNSLLIVGDKKISGASFADSNGYCASVFLPTNLMKKLYAINTNSDYVAFASKEPGTISIYSPDQIIDIDAPVSTLELVRSGASPNAPYKARLDTTPAGYRFKSNVPMAAWYQPNNDQGSSDEDETILYGSDLP